MTHRLETSVFSTIFLTLASAILLAGCAKSCSNSNQSVTSEKPGIQVGNPALSFDYKSASEILISKSNPETGDRWTSRIVRTTGDDWEIQLGPEGIPLQDRRADGTFIFHLLDTLKTLQTQDAGLSGPPESFGLSSPLYALRWKAKSEAGVREFEVKLGNPAPEKQGVYAVIGSDPKVLIAKGAALQMLARIESFQNLRLSTWSTIHADDIDELEIKSPGKREFYAQREGEAWADRKRAPLRAPVSDFMDTWTHFRVLEFVDDASLTARILPLVEKSPQYELIMKDRHQHPTTFKVSRVKLDQLSGIFGTTSTRPGAVFLLHDQVVERLRPFVSQ